MPPTVTAGVLAAEIVPSATASVTVRLAESTSANGVDLAGQTRLPFRSSVTLNDAGAETIGASLTGVIVSKLEADEKRLLLPLDSAIVVVIVRGAVLLEAGV